MNGSKLGTMGLMLPSYYPEVTHICTNDRPGSELLNDRAAIFQELSIVLEKMRDLAAVLNDSFMPECTYSMRGATDRWIFEDSIGVYFILYYNDVKKNFWYRVKITEQLNNDIMPPKLMYALRHGALYRFERFLSAYVERAYGLGLK